jgi:hypothetical protein
MGADMDYFRALQRYRVRTHRRRLDDKGDPIGGSGFNLDRPDAPEMIEALGLMYEAVRAGLQALDDAQIDALFEADLSTALEYAYLHIAGFNDMTPAQQLVVVDVMLDMGPTRFESLMRAIAMANAGEWTTGFTPTEAATWYDVRNSKKP